MTSVTRFESEQTGVITDHFDRKLIKATALCKDIRTDKLVPLTFFFCRNLASNECDEKSISSLISLTVVTYGYSFYALKELDSRTLEIDAQKFWNESKEK